MSLNPVKPFAEFYTKMELLPGKFYMVQNTFNDTFTLKAQEYALEKMKREIFNERYAHIPRDETGDSKQDAIAKASRNWTVVSFTEVIEWYGEFMFWQKTEEAKLIVACSPVNGEPPIEDVLPFVSNEKLAEIKSFFPRTIVKGSPPINDALQSSTSSKPNGKAKKATKG